MGVLASHRGVDLSDLQAVLDDEDGDHEWATAFVGDRLGIGSHLSRETAYVNDEFGPHDETPAQAWERMRNWAERNAQSKEPKT